ncbi:ATP-binding protein [Nocardiopsis sp. NPDC055551]|uniref:ATP-binding protein n=1 Tax=Nocardiopsis listeri TaxID=53440 RepID=UPI001D37582C|nr:ATP-binding protein [Nocardiopsis listeri]HJE59076.1 ATP-binding protein [Nocardiopsis listeri]
MTTIATPRLPEVTLPLGELVPARYRHYFQPDPTRAAYRVRSYEFGSSPQWMPLVRAFLNTAAGHRDPDFRHLFTLLGSELASNALRHTRSGRPLGHYTLRCERRRTGLHLTCRDQGTPGTSPTPHDHLRPAPHGLDSESDGGRGLALVDHLAPQWGDDGFVSRRRVWFFLPYDLTDSPWNDVP